MRQLIITADDFGLAEEVNQAVELGHLNGVLSAASLMVGASAAQDAVERARRLPNLRVGLHVAVVHAKPVLPPEKIPDIVDSDGLLPSRLVGPSFRWAFSAPARLQLEMEISAQFAAYAATGLTFDHVNAHNHMHMHPVVLDIVLRQARHYGVRHMRLPREPGGFGNIQIGQLALGLWIRLMRSKIHAAGLLTNDWVFGIAATGLMKEKAFLEAFDQMPEGVTELYVHPATQMTDYLKHAWGDYDGPGELAALTSQRVQKQLASLGLRAVGFRDLVS